MHDSVQPSFELHCNIALPADLGHSTQFAFKAKVKLLCPSEDRSALFLECTQPLPPVFRMQRLQMDMFLDNRITFLWLYLHSECPMRSAPACSNAALSSGRSEDLLQIHHLWQLSPCAVQ